jgi:cation diffusion facilitator family transporter
MSAKSRAAAVSVGSNTTLVVLKLLVGWLSGSVSILSEAIHSANDLLAAVIAWVSVRTSDRAADREHPYGHGKIEGISGAVEAALIVVAGVWIIVEAVRKLRHGGEVEHLGLGTAVMVVSVAVNIGVSRYLFKVAKQEDSLALEADAHHLSTDVFTSLGVAGGLSIVWGWRWWTGGSTALDIVDPLVAMAVAAFILKIGVDLTRTAVGHLLDERLPDRELDLVSQILAADDAVLEWHGMRSRKSGSHRYIEMHVTMSGDVTLAASHAVARRIEDAIGRALPPAHVVVHVDPIDALPSDRRVALEERRAGARPPARGIEAAPGQRQERS